MSAPVLAFTNPNPTPPSDDEPLAVLKMREVCRLLPGAAQLIEQVLDDQLADAGIAPGQLKRRCRRKRPDKPNHPVVAKVQRLGMVRPREATVIEKIVDDLLSEYDKAAEQWPAPKGGA